MNDLSTTAYKYSFKRLIDEFPAASTDLPDKLWAVVLIAIIAVGLIYLTAMVWLGIVRRWSAFQMLASFLPAVVLGVLTTLYYLPASEHLTGYWRWLWGLGTLLGAALCYNALMYFKDSQSVGGEVASCLGLLRAAVFAVLAFVFLLPAMEKYDQTITRSKAVLLFDTSLSMLDTRDDPPAEKQDPLSLPTRQQKVLAFLKDEKIDFVKRLTDVNHITAYRFGASLDESPWQFADGRFYSKVESEDLARHPEKRRELPPPMAMPHEFWAGWLQPTAHLMLPLDADAAKVKGFKEPHLNPGDWIDIHRDRFEDLARYNYVMHNDKGLFDGTNVYQALADTLAREQNNLTRAIVLFSDGRSHLGSAEAIEDIKRKAKEKGIPIIVVGIGSTRPKARIEVADVRHPKQIQPEDSFRVVAEIKGEGVSDEAFKVLLEVTKVKTVDGIKDGMPVKIETKQDITVVEQRPPKKRNPDEKPKEDEKEPPLEEVKLGQSLILTLPQDPKFDAGPRQRTAVEFQIEAPILAQVAAKGADEDLATAMKNKPLAVALASLKGKTDAERREFQSKFEKIKKWGLGETAKDEEYRFRVYLPKKHPLDVTPGRDHLEKTGGVRVVKKPLSILIFTSSPSKDYQFLRELLIRETQKDLARLTLVFQTTDARESGHAIGVVHGVPERRLLTAFPSSYQPDKEIKETESEEAINNLATYDVIVALDPDWTRLTEQNGKNIARWVENGGGLIVVGGPMFTKRLARPGDYRTRLQPIIDLLPVVLKDIDVVEVDRKPDQPWNLEFTGATQELEFLRLTDEPLDKVPFLEDWQRMYGRSLDPERKFQNGFYSYYPVKKATPGSQVLAVYGDPKAKTDDLLPMPYFVISDSRSPKRVIWIGSSETWRLRQAKEAYHERFWTKLLRYAGARTQGKINKQLVLELGGPYKTDSVIDVSAKAMGSDGVPLTTGELQLTLKPRGLIQGKVDLEHKLKPKTGTDNFAAQFRINAPGTFDVELTMPERPGLVETGTLVVESSNLEKDDTRPDFETLYKLASDLDEVKERMSGRDYDELLKALARPKVEGETEKAKSAEKEKPRLFFELSNADLIPTCIDKNETKQTSKGKPEDIWDIGVLGVLACLMALGLVGIQCAAAFLAFARSSWLLGVCALAAVGAEVGYGITLWYNDMSPIKFEALPLAGFAPLTLIGWEPWSAPLFSMVAAFGALSLLAIVLAVLRPNTKALGWGMTGAVALLIAFTVSFLALWASPRDRWNTGIGAISVTYVLIGMMVFSLASMQITTIVMGFLRGSSPIVAAGTALALLTEVAFGITLYVLKVDVLDLDSLTVALWSFAGVVTALAIGASVLAILEPSMSSLGWGMAGFVGFQWVGIGVILYLMRQSPPATASILMLAVTLLLSLEWLTRKMLRLA